MQSCIRCDSPEALTAPYCTSCGHPRIVESLKAATAKPFGYEMLLRSIAAIVVLWLVATVGIAFLREAKALRHARILLQTGHAQRAYNLVEPFVKSHSDNLEGLFLAGASAIKINRTEEARHYYESLSLQNADEEAMEKATKLVDIFHQEISTKTSKIGCNRHQYQTFYQQFRQLGEDFSEDLRNSAANAVRNCATQGNERTAQYLAKWLIVDNGDTSLVTSVYLEPMKAALDEGRYAEAIKFAQQATSWAPDSLVVFNEALAETRSRVHETIEGLQRLCSRLRDDTAYRVGRFSCFPSSAPAVVDSARDSWRQPVIYSALSFDQTIQCHQGFQLVSLGADGAVTTDDHESPASDISCRFDRGRERWNRPVTFWLPQK